MTISDGTDLKPVDGVCPGPDLITIGSRWDAGWCQQLTDQGTQQPLSSGSGVMHELEEPQIQRQGLLGDPSVGTEP